MRLRSATALVLVISILNGNFATSTASETTSNQVISFQTIRQIPHSEDQIGVLFSDNNDQGYIPGILYGYNLGPKGFSDYAICTSLTDSNCSNVKYFQYYSILRPCISADSQDCIEKVFARKDNDKSVVDGNLEESFPKISPYNFSGAPGVYIPKSGTPLIYRIPNVKSGGGSDKYLVTVTLNGYFERTDNGFIDYSYPMQNTRLVGSIVPVNVLGRSLAKPTTANVSTDSTGRSSLGFSVNPGGEDCAATDYGQCAMPASFATNYSYGLKLRLSRKLNSWLHGRVSNARLQGTFSNNTSFLEIEGLPVTTPLVGGWITPSKIASSDRPAISQTQTPGSLSGPASSSIEELKSWMNYLGRSSIGEVTQWNFREIGSRELNNLATNIQGSNSGQNSSKSASCIKSSNSVSGMVSTNSTTYASGPPIYNSESDSLDYKVLSPELTKSGDPFRGTYDLFIDKSVAECIYGHSLIANSAIVSIIYEDAAAVVSTEIVQKIDNLFHISIKGFSFKSPAILRVSFKDEVIKPVDPQNSPSPSPSVKESTSPKAKQILCYKGRLTKVITSKSAKCPKGYKIKR